jgi:enoyl-CoA hydratase/carnithine racemase
LFNQQYTNRLAEPRGSRDVRYETADGIASASPFAVERTKRLALTGMSADLRDHVAATRTALAECFVSEGHAEGVAAFLERRAPDFTGR